MVVSVRLVPVTAGIEFPDVITETGRGTYSSLQFATEVSSGLTEVAFKFSSPPPRAPVCHV